MDELEKRIPSAEICMKDVTKNNGVVKPSVFIREDGRDIMPNFYIDEFYRSCREGDATVQDVAGAIESLNRELLGNAGRFDVSVISDYALAKGRIFGKLVNAEMNREMLSKVPHREFMDLALVYSIDVTDLFDGNDGKTSMNVSNALMMSWGLAMRGI